MLPTYYCCLSLDQGHERFLRESMDELSGLMSKPPLEIDYGFAELPKHVQKAIEGSLAGQDDIWMCFVVIKEQLRTLLDGLGMLPRLLVLCSSDSEIARLAVKKQPNALWGLSDEIISLTYNLNNKYVIWHETLHLLGTDDCYDLAVGRRGPTCECRNCIMQYEATGANVGDWPFLCEPNIKRIRERLATWEEKTRPAK